MLRCPVCRGLNYYGRADYHARARLEYCGYVWAMGHCQVRIIDCTPITFHVNGEDINTDAFNERLH
jgi:hypothetical protein